MTIYAYRCRSCGMTMEGQSAEGASPCSCGGRLSRDYSTVQFGLSAFRPHFNHALGTEVSSSRDFDEKLRVHNDRTNQSLSRLEPGEIRSMEPKTETEAIETSLRARRDSGQLPPSSTVIL